MLCSGECYLHGSVCHWPYEVLDRLLDGAPHVVLQLRVGLEEGDARVYVDQGAHVGQDGADGVVLVQGGVLWAYTGWEMIG